MKRPRLRRTFLAGSLFATVALAGSLAGYTPIACGCQGPWEELASFINLPKDSWREMTAQKIEHAATKRYAGERLSWMTLPPKADCSMIAKRTVRCTSWLWQKPGSDPQTKGYEMTFLVDKRGVFESVHVDDIELPPRE
jgi:hypothetical protein